jgi:hypothetical protein
MMSSLPLIGIGCKRFSKVGFMFARASGFRALLSELRDLLRIQSRFTFVQKVEGSCRKAAIKLLFYLTRVSRFRLRLDSVP